MSLQLEKNTLIAPPHKLKFCALKNICCVLLIMFSTTIYAESDQHEHHHEEHHEHLDHKHHDEHDHDSEFTQHAAHQHGHANGSISFSENEIIVSLTLPSIDVFGFEHKATNQQEQTIIDNALKELSMIGNIIKLEPTCETSTHQVNYEPPESSNDSDIHSDVIVNTHFACGDDSARQIIFELSNITPSIEHIEIGYISDNKQALFSVTPDNNSITLD